MKKITQKLLLYFGLRLAKIPEYIDPIAPFDLLEMAIRPLLLERKEEFYFVQIGANDGILCDSLNPLIRKYRLRGCLVEPMKDVFSDLKRNYSDQFQLDFRELMIGNTNGTGMIYRFKRDAPVPANFYHGLARQDPNYIHRRAKAEELENYIESVECRMEKFDTFMSGLPVKHISLLYIDTEGSDDKIIEAAFQAGVFPEIINYEWTEMSAERRYLLKMMLLDHGYRFIDVGADTVCVRSEHA